MVVEKLDTAISAAQEFLRRAIGVRAGAGGDANRDICPSKHSGALRRQSLELTRALADLRRHPNAHG